jgi:hypothetical protein
MFDAFMFLSSMPDNRTTSRTRLLNVAGSGVLVLQPSTTTTYGDQDPTHGDPSKLTIQKIRECLAGSALANQLWSWCSTKEQLHSWSWALSLIMRNVFGRNNSSSFGNKKYDCSPMVGRSSRTLTTRVQILVLAHFPGFIPGFSGVMR